MYSKSFNKSDKTWSVLHTNLRGFSSKKKSLSEIVNILRPNVVTMNEVGLRKDKKVALGGYNCYTRNRKTNESMGGVATAVINEEKMSTLKILEGENKDEFIVSRHGQFQRPINVINCYGEQESRTEKSEIEEKWARLTKVLKDIENREEEAILIGDLNKMVGNNESGIKENHSKVSFGGKLVLDLVSNGEYFLVNGSDKCTGGPFTREEPNNPSIKSCLDLVLVSKGLVQYIEELVIDKERKFTPHRVIKGKKLLYTDHFSLHFKLKGIPLKDPSMRKETSQVIWNTNKPGGWLKYKELTEDNATMKGILENADKMTSNEMMTSIEKVSNKIRFQCFGKVRNSRRLEGDKTLENLYKEKLKTTSDAESKAIETKIADILIKNQKEEYEKKLDYLKTIKQDKGKSAAIFKLKDKVVGSRKEGCETVSMNDPISGEMICDPEELKKASVKYLSSLLEKREPKEEFKRDLQTLKLLHHSRMEEQCNEDDELTEKDFDELMKRIKKKKAEKYKFTINGGKVYRKVLFRLYKKVWHTEQKPVSWERTDCTMLYKLKGSKSEFGNQRFIHSKDEVPKNFEALVIEKAKPKIIQKCSKFQIGGLPGHQSAEHLFTLKSLIALFSSQEEAIIVNCFDLKKYFDSEVLIDAMDNLYKSGIKGKLYRLIYEVNKSNLIQIKTPVGVTSKFRTGGNVTQGSVGGGLISSLNLDIPIQSFFKNSEHEVSYGSIHLSPIIYQDDLARVASSVMSAQAGIDRVEVCMETKMLDLHDEKSCFLVFGNGKSEQVMKKELLKAPLTLYGKPMVQKEKEKYLGDYLHCKGLAASVKATVDARAAALKSGAIEVRAIVEDCRSACLGGLSVGLEIYEMAYIPALLNNSQTWMEIDTESVEKLENLQCDFLRILLATPASTPRAALLWDCGAVKVKYRIIEKKLIFLHYIMKQSEESLARQIIFEQRNNGFPGLFQECKQFIEELKIVDPFQIDMSALEWKKIVKRAIQTVNEDELKEEIRKKYKKLMKSDLVDEEFGRKKYISNLNLQQARTKFKFRSSMTQNVKMNQRNNKEYADKLWKCDECGQQDTNTHLLWCAGYATLREGKDLGCDKQLCNYLHKIFLELKNHKSL